MKIRPSKAIALHQLNFFTNPNLPRATITNLVKTWSETVLRSQTREFGSMRVQQPGETPRRADIKVGRHALRGIRSQGRAHRRGAGAGALGGVVAGGDVAEGATVSPVTAAWFAEVAGLGEGIVVVVAELGVGGIAARALEVVVVLRRRWRASGALVVAGFWLHMVKWGWKLDDGGRKWGREKAFI